MGLQCSKFDQQLNVYTVGLGLSDMLLKWNMSFGSYHTHTLTHTHPHTHTHSHTNSSMQVIVEALMHFAEVLFMTTMLTKIWWNKDNLKWYLQKNYYMRQKI